jgi:transcriptional accessory protein Tex/SPT6
MPGWQSYVQRSAPVLTRLPQEVLDFAGQQETLTLRALLEIDSHQSLPLQHLEGVVLTHSRWNSWKNAVEDLPDSVPVEVWQTTQHLDQLAALKRLHRLFATSEVPPVEEAWLSGLKIWDGASKVAWKSGSVRFKAIDLQHARLNQYTELINTEEDCAEVAAHRWLSARRGELEGVLRIEFELPVKRMLQQVEVHREKMGECVSQRSHDSLLQELVLDDIQSWLRYRLQEAAEKSMNTNIARTYRLLLEQQALEAEECVAIYIGSKRNPTGAVHLNRDGEILNQHSFAPGNNVIHGLKAWLGQCGVKDVILPIRAPHMRQLQQAIRELSKTHQVQRVREAGLSEARLDWEKDETAPLATELASAYVLGRRALFPNTEWSRIDPVRLGLGEYQDLLHEERLRQTLLDEQSLFALSLERVVVQKAPKVQVKNTPGNLAALNPLVKTIHDLRPGMTLKGVVSNITNFGAFVQFGLPSEGLVHLSELSERFVSHPSEVVRVGQNVSVRVLSVDTGARRISLTMKEARPPREHSSKPRRKVHNNSSRAQALRDLENLFKS